MLSPTFGLHHVDMRVHDTAHSQRQAIIDCIGPARGSQAGQASLAANAGHVNCRAQARGSPVPPQLHIMPLRHLQGLYGSRLVSCRPGRWSLPAALLTAKPTLALVEDIMLCEPGMAPSRAQA